MLKSGYRKFKHLIRGWPVSLRLEIGMIVSFAWTTPAFLAERKSVTRRQWDDAYAMRFKPGSIHQAYDKSPRNGGKQIGQIRIRSVAKEPISRMSDSDYEAEGFKYMEECGLKIWGLTPRHAFQEWRVSGESYWVIRFEILSLPIGVEGGRDGHCP